MSAIRAVLTKYNRRLYKLPFYWRLLATILPYFALLMAQALTGDAHLEHGVVFATAIGGGIVLTLLTMIETDKTFFDLDKHSTKSLSNNGYFVLSGISTIWIVSISCFSIWLYNDLGWQLDFTEKGWRKAFDLFRFPIGAFTAGLAVMAFFATVHRSAQTAAQIQETKTSNNFSIYFKHREEFKSVLESITPIKTEPRVSWHHLYQSFFSHSSFSSLSLKISASTQKKFEYMLEVPSASTLKETCPTQDHLEVKLLEAVFGRLGWFYSTLSIKRPDVIEKLDQIKGIPDELNTARRCSRYKEREHLVALDRAILSVFEVCIVVLELSEELPNSRDLRLELKDAKEQWRDIVSHIRSDEYREWYPRKSPNQ
ncbi:hypothetical protein GCM10011369_35090 [Neiella marina]|uniref:Uncharacterized protein n=1 Tax=Neiella marina TaxID=508461 RepID=A0A8J2UA96_9GAMM|nr:hypothetical protein [Neiella marina]GGA89879.1 hypothetical protein GCM10011369_35090 [Neiella marina]